MLTTSECIEYLDLLAVEGVVDRVQVIVDPSAKETEVKWVDGSWVIDDGFESLINDLQCDPRYGAVHRIMKLSKVAVSCLKRKKGVVDYEDGCLWQYPYEAHLGVWYLKDGDLVHRLT